MSSTNWPEGLPSSWSIEYKGLYEEKHECYIDPETGREFQSMQEVSDYLNTINSNKATDKTGDKSPSETVIPETSEASDVAKDVSENKQETSEKSNEKNVVSGTQVEGLPPGWIKEVIVRRAKGNLRKDPYYLDPSSDYAFLSKLDALRYLETGDIENCAMKPKKKSEILMKSSSNTPTKAKSAEKKSTKSSNETKKSKKSTSTPPSRASKRLKTTETVEPQSEIQPEKDKNEGGNAIDDTKEVKDKEPEVEKSTHDEKTEIPLIPEPAKTVNGDAPIEVPKIPIEENVGIEERKNDDVMKSEVTNEVTNF